jgi:DNA-binding response OmpR family regulator
MARRVDWARIRSMATLTSAKPQRGCILVVEDRDDVRQGLAQLLEFNGFLVEEARDGSTALGHLEREGGEIALVVLDLTLPGALGGHDVRGRMLANPIHADIPTIIVTASDIDAPGRAGLCPTAWLEKPFRFDQLLDLVKRFVVPEATQFAPAADSSDGFGLKA